jgi:4-hydroxybenzoate polyprenyltransferase
MTIASQWLRLTRWREWAQSKLPYIAATALLLAPSDVATPRLLAMIGTVVPWAAFGYGINDIADRYADERAAKQNRAAVLSEESCALFLLLTAGAAFGLSLLWAADWVGPTLVLTGLALAAAYSLPPLRLKERGLVGVVAPAAAQWLLPVLALSAAERDGWKDPAAWSLGLVGLSIGVRWMGVHQLQDMAADRKAGLRTYALDGGPIQSLIAGAFWSELAFLGTGLTLSWPRSAPALLALVCWTFVAEMPRRRESFRMRLQTYDAAPLSEYYFLLLPGSLALGGRLQPFVSLGLAALFALLGAGYLKRMFDAWLRLARTWHIEHQS